MTLDGFLRAETDHMFRVSMQMQSVQAEQLVHLREPATAQNQTVTRSNQDRLYSSVILDPSKPAKFTLPEIGRRYMSMHVIDQDHYMLVDVKPGTFAAQDKITIEVGGLGPFEAPDWDTERLAVARKALNDIASRDLSSDYAFGRKEEARPEILDGSWKFPTIVPAS
ncbi:DUF1254 domain-containing protein [Sedimentimonas flavescens]|uniref:DUF1254 domain-containing protein n=1 Tax=Sedimentimonas flavescens TaxID=2851012 RepID=A0ABT3A033_9RHOB|nr:DUF1254 domain-containing protein [Sedimentimonas flavescens]MCV2879364.1 DUF1254 domain-containing protein [Sedimentimonas flavescens]